MTLKSVHCFAGGFQKMGACFRSPRDRYHSIFGSILGLPVLVHSPMFRMIAEYAVGSTELPALR